MRFGFGQTSKTSQGKMADLFDMHPSGNQSDKQFRQQLISTADFYKNIQQKETQLVHANAELTKKIDINTAIYQVIGYDEQLIANMKNKGLRIVHKPIHTEIKAIDLFKFTMSNTPKTYVDTNGNVWELKE